MRGVVCLAALAANALLGALEAFADETTGDTAVDTERTVPNRLPEGLLSPPTPYPPRGNFLFAFPVPGKPTR